MVKRKKQKKIISQQVKKKPNWFFWGLSAAVMIVLILFLIAVLLPKDELVFDLVKDRHFWQAAPGVEVMDQGDAVKLSKGPGELYLHIPRLNIDSAWYDVCVIEMKSPRAYDPGMLLFLSPFNKTYEQKYGFEFDTGPAGKFNKIILDLPAHGAWQGIIPGILIVPGMGNETAEIRTIRFIKSNPWLKCKAIWAMYSMYADPRLGTCFAMASPIFFGRMYNKRLAPWLWGWLALISALVILIFFLRLDKKVVSALLIVFFAVVLAAGAFLDLRNIAYYFKGMGRDINLYWGKSLLEKRGQVIGDPKFAEFMKFCDENIPLDARVINCVPEEVPYTPFQYLSATQVGFNLRPRSFSYLDLPEDKVRTFYIFYKSDICKREGITAKDLRMYKRYESDAYIMTK
jgi:hypothetical protein